MGDKKRIVYVVQHNHFDPIWRRGWLRTFDYLGRRYQPYAVVEAQEFDAWIENAKTGATFSEGQSVVVRQYIEDHPDKLPVLRDLFKKGIFDITAAGETVSDTNLPTGETYLRNLVLGQFWFDEVFGVTPTVGWLEDAFGSSAQVPQIFRGCEIKTAVRLSYKEAPGEYWKGLDGSVVFKTRAPYEWGTDVFYKIPPCDKCAGMGCDTCEHTGLLRGGDVTDEVLSSALAAEHPGEWNILIVGGEEAVPNPRIAELMAEANAKRDDVEFKFGTWNDLLREYADKIARVDDPSVQTSDLMEGNPTMTGCYVGRIKLKQEMRRVENLVNTAERWATVAFLLGNEYPSEQLLEAWRKIVFIGFHDAITSSHIDQAYFELLDMISEAENLADLVIDDALDAIEAKIKSDPMKDYLLLYNADSWDRSDPVTVTLSGTFGKPELKDASGKPVEILDIAAQGDMVTFTFQPPSIPPLGYKAIELIPDAEPIDSGDISKEPGEVENEFFKIAVSDKGIISIFDKRIGAELIDSGKYLCNELILEEDAGHVWGTQKTPSFVEGLSLYTTDVKIRRAENASEIMIMGQYKGSDTGTKILTWRQSTTIYKGVDRIDFRTEIDWDTAQRRLRVAIPTSIETDDGNWSIPYGSIGRSKYEPVLDIFQSENGDWPAVNWVDICDKNRGIALVNTGIPAHRIDDGTILMSILRSPTDPGVLDEPEFYDCPDFDGARDAGRHEFQYSLIPHKGDYWVGNIEKRAQEINNPMIIRSLEAVGGKDLGLEHGFMKIDATDNVIVTAVKKAEKDGSIIVRMAETAGKDGSASVTIEGGGKSASLVNFLERQDAPLTGKVTLKPFKIQTVKFTK